MMSKQAALSNPYLLLFDSLNENWAVYLHLLKKCRDQASSGAIHDLRISIRRMTTNLELILSLQPKQPDAVKLHDTLKGQLGSLRNLRDLQVECKRVRLASQRSPCVRRFLDGLERDQKSEKRSAERSLMTSVHARREARLLTRINEALLGRTHYAGELVVARRRLLRELQSRYDAFEKASKAAMVEDCTSLHQARIKFKKFRYAREALAPLLSEPGRANQKDSRFKELQGLLGDTQDAGVLLQALEGFAVQHKKSRQDRPMSHLRSLLASQRDSAARRFVRRRDAGSFRSLRPLRLKRSKPASARKAPASIHRRK